MARPPNYVKLIWPFSGDSDVERFISFFDEISELASWEDHYKVLLMRGKCIGAARRYLEVAIPLGEKLTYTELCTLLRNEFKPQEKLTVRLKRFRECKQLPKETVTTFAARVRTLGLAACDSKKEEETINSRLLAQFLEGLCSTRVLDCILTKDAKSFAEGVSLAREAESNAGLLQVSHQVHWIGDRQDPRIPRQERYYPPRGSLSNTAACGNTMRATVAQTPTSKERRFRAECLHCKRVGHADHLCRQKLRGEGRCFTCQEKGHLAKFCPTQVRRTSDGRIHNVSAETQDYNTENEPTSTAQWEGWTEEPGNELTPLDGAPWEC